jgi:peptidoglycan biosynthesis protein MviN/MurJ (putative lipid II flippase)
MLILNRGFYAVQANWIPMSVAVGNLALNAILDAVFYRFGVWGIPLATSVVNIAGTAALLLMMSRRVGLERLLSTSAAVVRIVAASVLAAGLALVVWYGLDRFLGRGLGAQIVSVALALASAAVVYLGLGRTLRVRELDALLLLRTRRADDTER